jgi:hypothetical protein
VPHTRFRTWPEMEAEIARDAVHAY